MYKDLQVQILEDFAQHDAWIDLDEGNFSIMHADDRGSGVAGLARRRDENMFSAVERWTKPRETCSVVELQKELALPNTKSTLTALGMCLEALGWTKVNRGFTSWVSPTASTETKAEQKRLSELEMVRRMREHRAKRLRKTSSATKR